MQETDHPVLAQSKIANTSCPTLQGVTWIRSIILRTLPSSTLTHWVRCGNSLTTAQLTNTLHSRSPRTAWWPSQGAVISPSMIWSCRRSMILAVQERRPASLSRTCLITRCWTKIWRRTNKTMVESVAQGIRLPPRTTTASQVARNRDKISLETLIEGYLRWLWEAQHTWKSSGHAKHRVTHQTMALERWWTPSQTMLFTAASMIWWWARGTVNLRVIVSTMNKIMEVYIASSPMWRKTNRSGSDPHLLL